MTHSVWVIHVHIHVFETDKRTLIELTELHVESNELEYLPKCLDKMEKLKILKVKLI